MKLEITKEIFLINKELILNKWLKYQKELISEDIDIDFIDFQELKKELKKFFALMLDSLNLKNYNDMFKDNENEIIVFLKNFVKTKAKLNISSNITMKMITSLKTISFEIILNELDGNDGKNITDELFFTDMMFDQINFYMFNIFVDEKEKLINEQYELIMELEVPMLDIMENVMLVPLMGYIDSEKSYSIMKKILNHIKQKESEMVILDITAINIVDTAVASHLIKISKAVSLMGGKAILSGMNPNVAEAIVNLGIDLKELNTTSTLRAAIAKAKDYLDK